MKDAQDNAENDNINRNVSNYQSHELYADGAFLFLQNGNLRITFTAHKNSFDGVKDVDVGHVVMPVYNAEALAKMMLDFINHQRELAKALMQEPSGTQQ